MKRLLVGTSAVMCGGALLCAALLVRAEEVADGPLVHKSVEGVLEKIVTEEEGLILKTDDGQELGWQLPAPVIAEAARIGVGSRMWVIYRQVDPDTQAVTALGFPGVADQPVYVNATGYPVVLSTGPAVDGKCGTPGAPAGADQKLGKGIVTVELSACWCCAPAGETCRPSNKSGNGRIVLAQCFPSPPGL